MSIVTSLLDKLQFIGAIGVKVDMIESKLRLVHNSIFATSIGNGRQWFSVTGKNEYRTDLLARRSRDELLVRLPAPR